MKYRSDPEDTFIVSFPKSGTTWAQMILYQLTSPGEMDIEHIRDRSPSLRALITSGGDLRRLARPVVVRSHMDYRYTPKGSGRYIYVMRDGLDVAVSYYHHYRRYHAFRGSFREFFDLFIKGRVYPGTSWFTHVATWVDNQSRLNLLVVRYEDLSSDLEGGIRRIAKFCRIETDEAQLSRVVGRCSFDFMREHERQLDPMAALKPAPGDGDSRFFRQGRVGSWRECVDEDMLRAYQREFDRRRRGAALGAYSHAVDTSRVQQG
jgi:hypothetical protein